VWVTGTLIANTITTFMLPVSVGVFMHRAEYYTAPLFVVGVGLAAIVSLLIVVATCIRIRGER
jgi:hypothetical protein